LTRCPLSAAAVLLTEQLFEADIFSAEMQLFDGADETNTNGKLFCAVV
jgi:hypothetical protein